MWLHMLAYFCVVYCVIQLATNCLLLVAFNSYVLLLLAVTACTVYLMDHTYAASGCGSKNDCIYTGGRASNKYCLQLAQY